MSDLFGNIKPILKDDLPLREAFIPERMLHRDGELKAVISCLKPLLNKRNMRDMFITGPTGTGKTTLIQYSFELLMEETTNVVAVYVNCWKKPTINAIMNKIYLSVNRNKALFAHKKTTSDLIKDVDEELKRQDKKLVIALDEVDRIEDMDFLYTLSRSDYGLVLLSNDPYALKNLDQRIRSSLSLENIEFRAYSVEEMFDILKDRVEYAFYPRSIDDSMIKLVSLNSNGDARVGLETLRKAALVAEDDNKEKVEREHIIKALQGTKNIKSSQIISSQTPEIKLLYKIIEEKGEIASSDLFKEFNERYLEEQGKTISERTFRKYMQKMVALKVLNSKGDVRWRKYSIVK